MMGLLIYKSIYKKLINYNFDELLVVEVIFWELCQNSVDLEFWIVGRTKQMFVDVTLDFQNFSESTLWSKTVISCRPTHNTQ